MKSKSNKRQMTLYVDEFKENSVSFTFEGAYKNFKVYYNEEHIGNVPGGFNELKKGIEFTASEGDKITLKLKSSGSSTRMAVAYNGIPIPSTPEYPANKIKTAARWVLGVAIVFFLLGVLTIIYIPELLNYWQGYLIPGLGAMLAAFSVGIKRYNFAALIVPLVLFIGHVIGMGLGPIEFRAGLFRINLFTIIETIAIIQMIRAIKPMSQMQAVKNRLKQKDRDDLLDF